MVLVLFVFLIVSSITFFDEYSKIMSGWILYFIAAMAILISVLAIIKFYKSEKKLKEDKYIN
jgi:uncharacterized membrane protein YidH (DUF202 family)